MATRLRRDMGLEVEMIRGNYGQYKFLVDGETVIDGGPLVIIGVMPPMRKTIEAVRSRLGTT